MTTPTVIFFDCQTNGSGQESQMIEVAWRIIASEPAKSEICESYFIQLNENQNLPDRIARLTGISELHLKQGITEKQLYHRIRKLIRNATKPIKWVIHYQHFEKAYLSRLFEKFSGNDKQLLGEFVCTHKLAKQLLPHLPSFSIHAVSGHLGYTVDKLKRSEEHIAATAFIWQRLHEPQDYSIPTQKFSGYLSLIDKGTRDNWPQEPGIYRMYAKDGQLLYVGKAKNIKTRLNSYFHGRKSKGGRLNEMLSQVDQITTEVLGSEAEALIMECIYIDQDKPKYNIALVADKVDPICIQELAVYPWTPMPPMYTLPNSSLAAIAQMTLALENTYLGELFSVSQITKQLKRLASELFAIKRLPSDLQMKLIFLLKKYWHTIQCFDTTDFRDQDINWEQLYEENPAEYLFESLHGRLLSAAIELQRAKWFLRLQQSEIRIGKKNTLCMVIDAKNHTFTVKGHREISLPFTDPSASWRRSDFNKVSTVLSLIKSCLKRSSPVEVFLRPQGTHLSNQDLERFMAPLLT